ncbi:hypothetical protein ABPG75_004891 [Micractinium tetrahymenae]
MTDYRKTLRAALSAPGGGGEASGPERTSFAVGGTLPSTLPGLQVEGLGQVGLPLAPAQAAALMALCERAPFGRGAETLVDTSRRDTWQLDASKVELQNPGWEDVVAAALDRTRAGLGLNPAVRVEARLHKLLLYEQGGHFAPHRDSEKEDGMFGTLVVVLPTWFEGGALVVRHGRRSERFELGETSRFQTTFAAFFADCEHEVEEVISGHRLCLVYRLVYLGEGTPPSADRPASGTLAAVRDALAGWEADPEGPEKLCLLLEHRYTQAGLTGLRSLKGTDRAAAELLVAAARPAGLDLHLAMLIKKEIGYAGVDDDWEWGGRTPSMDDICRTDYTLSGFVLLAGQKLSVDCKELTIEDEEREILQDKEYLEGLEESDRRVECTGNEGTDIELWYQSAAVVFWPASKCLQVEAGSNLQAAVSSLSKLLAKVPSACIVDMLSNLASLGDTRLVGRFITEAMPGKLAGRHCKEVCAVFPALCLKLGWGPLQQPLLALAAATLGGQHGLVYMADLLYALAAAGEGDAAAAPTLLALGRAAVEHMQADKDVDRSYLGDGDVEDSDAVQERAVPLLFAALLSVPGSEALLAELVQHLISHPRYTLDKVLLPVCDEAPQLVGKQAAAATEPFRRMLQHTLAQLEARSAAEPRAPANWARPANLGCDCADCAAAAAFLQDPSQKQQTFYMAKRRRSHVEYNIKYKPEMADVELSTDTSRGTHGLVLTKTHASYQRATEQHASDRATIARLRPLLQGAGEEPSGGRSKRSRRQ